MFFFRALAFQAYYLICTFGLGILGLPLMVSEKGARFVIRTWGHAVLWGLKAICNISCEVRGREHITAQPVIYASKHQSAWDIAIFLVLLARPSFVLKKELQWTPPVGWFSRRLKMIAVDRKKGAAAMKPMLEAARAALHRQNTIVIFPEGTRTAPGAKPRYLPGVTALYTQLMVPVVPVALNSGSYWGRNALPKKPGTIVIEFLPHIPPGLPPRELMKRLEGAIEPVCAKLLADER